MDLPLLQVKDVSYTYHTKAGETPALSHISFSVFPGEFVAIVGPSRLRKIYLFRYALRSFKTGFWRTPVKRQASVSVEAPALVTCFKKTIYLNGARFTAI